MASSNGFVLTNQSPFPSLPEELIKLIFEYACQQQGKEEGATRNDLSSRKVEIRMPIDIQTTHSIMLVSRAAYNLVIPLLYRTVTISKPSKLTQFAKTLLVRPSLGLFVRNFWAGAISAPALNFIPMIISDEELSVAARAHITRYDNISKDHQCDQNIFFRTTTDLMYVESGVEYAAMNVPPRLDRLVEERPQQDSGRVDTKHLFKDIPYWEDDSQSSRISLGKGFGVDRASMGYDAAGDWIGLDDWIIRCLELQYAIEFHWEWVGVTTPPLSLPSPDMMKQDQRALSNDPTDWADSNDPVHPLPSRQREFSTDTMASSSTTEYLSSNASKIGFNHIRQFFTLRKHAYSPRSAARILIEEYLKSVTVSGVLAKKASEVCNVNLLVDEDEMDHFLHPTLFARSGAIHLILAGEPPEGMNAPPNAIPATTANMFAFHDEAGSSDGGESSDEEERNMHHRVQRREVLDFVDLFGHIQGQSRTLYTNQFPQQTNNHDDFSTHGQTFTQEHFDHNHTRFAPRANLDREPRSAPTLGSLSANLRAILAMCPRIRVLGLNGFLERAIGGTRDCAGLSELKHLSLGPPPPFWSSALNLQQKTLNSLRSLHISGCMLFRSEAMAIGGYTSALPKLREVDWTLWLGHLLDHPINVVEALSCLLGKDVNSRQSTKQADAGRKKPLRKIRATLNAQDVEFLRKNANKEVLDDPRLILRQCASLDAEPNLLSVRRWWENKAGLETN